MISRKWRRSWRFTLCYRLFWISPTCTIRPSGLVIAASLWMIVGEVVALAHGSYVIWKTQISYLPPTSFSQGCTWGRFQSFECSRKHFESSNITYNAASFTAFPLRPSSNHRCHLILSKGKEGLAIGVIKLEYSIRIFKKFFKLHLVSIWQGIQEGRCKIGDVLKCTRRVSTTIRVSSSKDVDTRND